MPKPALCQVGLGRWSGHWWPDYWMGRVGRVLYKNLCLNPLNCIKLYGLKTDFYKRGSDFDFKIHIFRCQNPYFLKSGHWWSGLVKSPSWIRNSFIDITPFFWRSSTDFQWRHTEQQWWLDPQMLSSCQVLWARMGQTRVTSVIGSVKMSMSVETCTGAGLLGWPISVTKIVTSEFYMVITTRCAEWAGRFSHLHLQRSKQLEVFVGSLKLRLALLKAALSSVVGIQTCILLLSRDPFQPSALSAVKLEMAWTWTRWLNKRYEPFLLFLFFLTFFLCF